MEKALLLGLVFIGITFLACSQNAQVPATPTHGPLNGYGQFGGNRTRMNITQEQMQAMMQEQIDACSGKAENDTCIVTSPFGNQTGACSLRNETLRCRTMRQRPSG